MPSAAGFTLFATDNQSSKGQVWSFLQGSGDGGGPIIQGVDGPLSLGQDGSGNLIVGTDTAGLFVYPRNGGTALVTIVQSPGTTCLGWTNGAGGIGFLPACGAAPPTLILSAPGVNIGLWTLLYTFPLDGGTFDPCGSGSGLTELPVQPPGCHQLSVAPDGTVLAACDINGVYRLTSANSTSPGKRMTMRFLRISTLSPRSVNFFSLSRKTSKRCLMRSSWFARSWYSLSA